MSAANPFTSRLDNALANAAAAMASDGFLGQSGHFESALSSLYAFALASSQSGVTATAAGSSTLSGLASTTTTTTPPLVKATSSSAAPSWVASISDSVLKADLTAMAGNVTEVALAKMVTDLAAELSTSKTTLSASQFSDLKMIVSDLNVGQTASGYAIYTLNALVNGNAANGSWTGGAGGSSGLGNLAIGSSATQLSNLNGKWLLGTDLPSSTATVSGSSFHINYTLSTASLFGVTGPSANDINQGQLGDCYYLSSLAEVAYQNSALIRNMITVNGDGSYGVAFHFNGVTEYVTVNSMLQSGGNTGANMWGTLLEKAYAQFQAIHVSTGNSYSGNNFTAIGNGGWPLYALEAITGASQITNFSGSGSSWVCSTYNQSLVNTGTQGGLSTASLLNTLKADLAAGDDLILSSNTWSYDGSGKVMLVANHALSIYGINSSNGNLQVRNPWGTQSGQYWNTTFEVSLSSLLAVGDTITVDNIGGSVPFTPSAPVLTAQTANQTLAANHAFSVSLASAFTDPQGQALTYQVTQSNGQALPSWLTFNAQTKTLSGTTPVSSTSTEVLVKVTDTSGLSATETFTITDTAVAPILAKATATTQVTPGRSFSFTLPADTFTDPQGETLTYTAKLANGQALPSWLTFNAQTKTFSGTAPSAATSLSLQVIATNQAGLSASESFTLNDSYLAPTLKAQTADQTIAANHAFSVSLASAFADPQALALTYKVTLENGQALPSWMTFNAQTGVLSGTTPVSSSSTKVVVTATDSAGLSASESFTISDTAVAPILAKATATTQVLPGRSFSFALPAGTFTDPQGETLTYSAKLANGQALPSWLLFNAQTQTFSGTAPSSSSTLSVQVVATNQAGLSAAETFTLNETYFAPTLKTQTANQTLAANHAFSVSLANTFADPQALALTYKVTLDNGQALPSWMSFNAQTGVLSGTTPVSSSSTKVVVTATDSAGLSASESFTISDTAVAPILAKATAETQVLPGRSFSFALPAGTFTDPQGETLTYSAKLANGQALPSWLLFNAQTQTFSGTAPSSSSTLSVQVVATNQAGLSASETFTLNETYFAPVLKTQTANQTVAANHAFSVSLANTFADPQALALTYKVTQDNGQALPSWMTFNAQTGVLSGTTPVSSSSTKVLVTATDSAGLSATETFTITDTALAPTLVKATAATQVLPDHSFSFALPAGSFTDPQGETLTYSAKLAGGQALPSWLTFNAQTQTFSGIAPSSSATLSVQVVATNQAGLSASETFTLNETYFAPKLNTQTATQTINGGKAFSFTLPSTTFVDPQGLALTYKAALSNGQALPSWLNFDARTETFSGTAPAAAGTFNVTLTATDSAGLSTSETFAINDLFTAPKPPVFNPLPLVMAFNNNGTLSITVPSGTFVDPEGQALTYSATQSNGQALPSWITFNAKTDSFIAIPGNQTESANITVKATDPSGLSASETFSLSIGGMSGSNHGLMGSAPGISLVGVHPVELHFG